MDIAGLSTIMKTTALQEKVSMKVLDKTLDTNEILGAGLVEMLDSAAMEQSVTPYLGGNVDFRI